MHASALGDEPGERVMRVMDEAMRKAKDQLYLYDVVTKEPGKATRTMVMKVHIKGKDWRRIDFLSPGDVKGMKALVLSLTQMYVYLPAYKKIRRVASHARAQSFMGTALSQDDTSITQYGEVYAGKLLSEDKTSWKVEGTRKPGKDFPYSKIIFTILKKEHQPSELLYFGDKGAKLKTETRKGYECREDICTPSEMTMVDHGRNGLSTTLLRKDWQLNTGVADSYFTPRDLQMSH
jgi:hypothetical protein